MSPRSQRLALLALAVAALVLAWWWTRPDAASDPAAPDATAAGDDAQLPKRRGTFGDGARPLALSGKFPWQHEAAVVSGYVRSEDGKGIGDAQVCLWSEHDLAPSSLTRDPHCVDTDPDGHYRIEGVPPIRAQVHASAPGYVPARFLEHEDDDDGTVDVVAGTERDGIDFTLAAGGVKVLGVVKDLSGGVVEGALVHATSVGKGNLWWGARPRSIARTDADGKFELWAAEGDVYVSANADGYSSTSRSGVAPGYTFELFLTPESVISGRVVMAGTGKPVANASVRASGRGFGGWSNVMTDEDGRFVIDGLEPGSYHPSATNEEVYGVAAEAVHVGLAESASDIVIEAHPMPSVSGTLVIAGTKGAPCTRGGRVSLTGKEGNSNTFGGAAEPDGSVVIRGVRPGTYAVSASCDKHVRGTDYDDIVVADAPITDQVWAVDKGIALTGRVVDADGAPVPGARVSAVSTRAGRGAGASMRSWDRVDDEGNFEAEGLVAGTYHVDANAPGYLEADPIEVELGASGGEPVELKLERGGKLRGTVRDERGEPIAGANVRVTNSGWNANASTDDEGAFELDGAKPGEHRVFADIGWRDELRVPGATDDSVRGVPVTIVAGEVAQVDLVVESQDGTIAGRVLDDDGGPVADAFIDYSRESDSAAAAEGRNRQRVRWGSWGRDAVLTDQDGNFALDELADGNYTIRAYRKGGGEALVEHVAVGSTGVELKIAETGSIGGVVTLAGGGFPEDFSINVHDKAQGVHESDHFFRTDGTFVISELPPGDYEVTVSSDDGDASTTAELDVGADVTDVKLELSPRAEVSGRLLDLETQEPVAGLQVSISPRKGGRGFRFGGGSGDEPNISDDQGHFTVEKAAVGRVRLMMIPRDFQDPRYGWTSMSAEIPSDAKTHDLGDLFVVPKRRKDTDDAGDLGLKFKEQPPEDDSDDFPLEVAFVRPGGPAAAAGVSVGDVVESIDGHDVTGTNRYRWYGLASVAPGTAVTLGLAGGKSAKVTADDKSDW